MRARDAGAIGPRWQRWLTWLLEASLVVMFFVGVFERSTGIIVNTAVALVVSQLPALLERDYGITLDTGLTLWITGAVWLHALGTVGVPGAEQNFYATIPWWDHATHTLSSSVVAAAGYTTVRAIDRHSEDIYLPPRFTFVFVLLFVLAFGVLWEVIEFALSQFATLAGASSVLVQYGLEDTMLDLVFDTIGAVVVALWGTAHLTDAVGIVTGWLESRDA